jgi:hypothetical protein
VIEQPNELLSSWMPTSRCLVGISGASKTCLVTYFINP